MMLTFKINKWLFCNCRPRERYYIFQVRVTFSFLSESCFRNADYCVPCYCADIFQYFVKEVFQGYSHIIPAKTRECTRVQSKSLLRRSQDKALSEDNFGSKGVLAFVLYQGYFFYRTHRMQGKLKALHRQLLCSG